MNATYLSFGSVMHRGKTANNGEEKIMMAEPMECLGEKVYQKLPVFGVQWCFWGAIDDLSSKNGRQNEKKTNDLAHPTLTLR